MKARGTIIGRLPLTETSLIVKWCTEEAGLIKTVAKGARRKASPFSGKIDLFFHCEVEIHPARKGDLHILKDLEVMESRLGLRRDYRQTLAASYFVRWIELAAEPETPVPEMSDLLERGLNFLDDKEISLKAVLHFEKELSRILGLDAGQGESPVDVLGNLYGRIPEQREGLLERLDTE